MKIILVDAKYSLITPKGEVFNKMYQMLEKYPNKKIILTNADYKKENILNLNDTPYEVFTLKHNPDKIDPQYYETMLNNFGFKAKDVIYFEHSKDAVKSAQAVGIRSYYYDNNVKDLVALKDFIDQNL